MIFPFIEKQIQELYPPSKYPPSARALIRRKFALFEKTKNPRVAEELDRLGFTADFHEWDTLFLGEEDFRSN